MIVAVSGFYWDVAKHIDSGRDASPFGTPAHYPILIGLIGIALGGRCGERCLVDDDDAVSADDQTQVEGAGDEQRAVRDGFFRI